MSFPLLVAGLGVLRPAVSCCVVRKDGRAGITVVSTDTLLETGTEGTEGAEEGTELLGTLETVEFPGRLEAGAAFVGEEVFKTFSRL